MLCYVMFQIWNVDDSYSRMARDTCICDRDCTWNKRHGWDRGNIWVPRVGVSNLNPTNRCLVDMVSGTNGTLTSSESVFCDLTKTCYWCSGVVSCYVLLLY